MIPAAVTLLWMLQPPPSPAGEWQQLRSDLDSLPREARIERLDRFLEAWAEREPSAPSVLEAHARRATSLLLAFEADRARSHFEAILRHAPATALDVRGRASFGAAQCEEILGQREPARRRLERLKRAMPGTRWADLASATRRRLDEPRLRNGAPAPAFGVVRDLDDRTVTRDDLLGDPALLLFFDPEDSGSLDRIDALRQAAADSGVGPESILAFSVSPDTTRLRELVQARKWNARVVALGGRGLLAEPVMRYRVRAMPASFVLAPNGILVARDLTPTQLRRLFARSR